MINIIRRYLQCERGFLGLGGDKVTTVTDTLSDEDARSVRSGRQAGQRAAGAYRDTQIAGMDPRYANWMRGYQGLQRQGSDLFNTGQGMIDYGSQIGLSNLGDYMNPMLEQYFQRMDPMYQHQANMAGMQFDQNATSSGAFGGARQAVANEYGRNQVGLQKAADYGNRTYNAASQGAEMLVGDRARQLQMGQALSQLGMSGQDRALAAQVNLGDYGRNVQNEIYRHPAMMEQNALNAITGAHGQNIQTTSENRQEGSVLGDIMGIAGMGAGMLFGGPAGAALGGSLGGMFGSSSISDSPIMGGGGGYQPLSSLGFGSMGGGSPMTNSNLWNYNTPSLSLGGQQNNYGWGG